MKDSVPTFFSHPGDQVMVDGTVFTKNTDMLWYSTGYNSEAISYGVTSTELDKIRFSQWEHNRK